MGYEVDFLPVGSGEKSGDAIAFRFGNLSGSRGEQFVAVVDGGNKESGQALVDHIKEHYKTAIVDLVVNTHPDADHASGLTVVLENLKVNKLWMHRPWADSSRLNGMFKDGRVTTASLGERLKASLDNVNELERLAEEQGVPIEEPFAGTFTNHPLGSVFVLGPSLAYYESLLPNFRETPEARDSVATANLSFGGWLREQASALATLAKEAFGIETLKDPKEDATSAENNSSAVLMLDVDGHKLLLAGDAGVPALSYAADFAEANGVDLKMCNFSQIPHHGSRRNVGPTILDRIVGPKLRVDDPSRIAFVSVAKDSDSKHPAKKVTNAYRRRGAKVVATQGSAKVHFCDSPSRTGWVSAEPLPFYNEVEED